MFISLISSLQTDTRYCAVVLGNPACTCVSVDFSVRGAILLDCTPHDFGVSKSKLTYPGIDMSVTLTP